MNPVNSGLVPATTGRVHATTDRVPGMIGRMPRTIGRVPATVGRMSEEIAAEYQTCLMPTYRTDGADMSDGPRLDNLS
jgi:hypothetical protein